MQIHLRQFNKTRYSAIDPAYLPETEEVVAPEPSPPTQFATGLDSEGETEAVNQ